MQTTSRFYRLLQGPLTFFFLKYIYNLSQLDLGLSSSRTGREVCMCNGFTGSLRAVALATQVAVLVLFCFSLRCCRHTTLPHRSKRRGQESYSVLHPPSGVLFLVPQPRIELEPAASQTSSALTFSPPHLWRPALQ